MTSRVISDLPTIADALDRLWVVRGIANQIATCDAPQTFGVHGDWGSGKTSLLRQMRYHLSGETEGAIGTPPAALEAGKYKATLVTIWFEAWRYQNEPVPVVALLGEMRRQFGLMAQIKSKGKKLASVSFRSLLNTLGEVSGKLIGAEGSPILVIVAYIYQFHGDLFQRWQNEPDFFLTIREWVGGQLGKSRTLSDGRIVIDLPDHFGRLQLPGLATTDPNAPTPQTVFQSTHPDPTAPEVFWIGRLIGELGSRLRPEDFLPLLRLVPAP